MWVAHRHAMPETIRHSECADMHRCLHINWRRPRDEKRNGPHAVRRRRATNNILITRQYKTPYKSKGGRATVYGARCRCALQFHIQISGFSPFHQSTVIDDDDDHLKQHNSTKMQTMFRLVKKRRRGSCTTSNNENISTATIFSSLIYYCDACDFYVCMCHTKQMIRYECMSSMHLFCLSASAIFPSSIEQFESIDTSTQSKLYATTAMVDCGRFCCCRLNSSALIFCFFRWCRLPYIRYFQRKTRIIMNQNV